MPKNALAVFTLAALAAMAAACSNSPDPEIVVAGVSARLTVESAAFADGDAIPVDHTCDGADASPALTWSAGPSDTVAYAVTLNDPDARGFVHWVIYDLPADVISLPEAMPMQKTVAGLGIQGTNDFGRIGYGGPCPPGGSPHTYNFTVFALDALVDLPAGEGRDGLMAAVSGHVLAAGTLSGSYQRR